MGHFYFTRHGESVWNIENKICGSTDIALTEKGRSQAVKLGEKILEEKFDISEIICSPLIRAKETAEEISKMTGIPCRVEDRITEQCFGRFEATPRNGKEFAEFKTHFAESFNGGESMMRVAQRIYNVIDEICSQDDKVYLIVAHNGIARVVQSYFYDMTNEEYSKFGIKNCEILRYDY